MKGNFVGVAKALSTLPIQNRTATSIPNPKLPFNNTLMHMLRGMTLEAFSISSAAELVSMSCVGEQVATIIIIRLKSILSYPYERLHQSL